MRNISVVHICFMLLFYRIADIVGISYSTLKRRLKVWNMRKNYSNINDEELHIIITECYSILPNAGERMVIGYLKSLGLYVQRRR